MLRACISLLAGAYAMALSPALPDRKLAIVVALAGVFCLLHPRCRILAAFLAGVLLLWLASLQIIDQRLAPGQHGRDLSATVQVTDFVNINSGSARFMVAVIDNDALPSKMRLSWLNAPRIPRIGEVWDLRLRLRRPRGLSNPYAFDYEAWLFRNRIGATGYVVSGSLRDAVSQTAAAATLRLRARLAERIDRLFPDDEASAVLAAITVGARQNITRDAWSRYARTGTTHLMAISGLHIGLAGGAALLVAWSLLAVFVRRGNVRDLALLAALPIVWLYALLAGLAVPAQRAALMVFVAAVAVLLRRPPAPLRQLSLVCFFVVIADPVLVLMPGFKLSFAAVAILFWHALPLCAPTDSRLRPLHALLNRLRHFWRLQEALLFGLFAATAILFGRAAWLAPFVNLVVLPIFSLITVPLSLAGLLLHGKLEIAGDTLLFAAYQSVKLVLAVVRHAANLPFADVSLLSIRGPFVVAAALTALHAALPVGWPGRRLAWVGLLAAMLYKPPPPPSGCADLYVLDVGQGLAAVIRSSRHTVVFDAGASFRGGGDSALLVIVPFLDGLAIEQVDLLVISHADLDHAGGVRSLTRAKRVLHIVAGEPRVSASHEQDQCRVGQDWTYDALQLSVVHPTEGAAWSGNNASCVVLARIGPHRVLLTGDIEATVENLLAGGLSTVSTVLVPHHGSNTSSTTAFASALRADVAIVSAGFGNRWGFPAPAVVDRWQRAGSDIANTAVDGAVMQRFCQDAPAGRLRRHRQEHKRFWQPGPGP